MKNFILILSVFLISRSSFSQVDQEALLETQRVLRSPTERQDIISKDKKAQDTDQFASQVVGGDPKLKDEVYDISADVLNSLLQTTNGDPEKAQELLLKAMKNPEQFLKSLPALQQEKIRGIANSVEKKKNSKP